MKLQVRTELAWIDSVRSLCPHSMEQDSTRGARGSVDEVERVDDRRPATKAGLSRDEADYAPKRCMDNRFISGVLFACYRGGSAYLIADPPSKAYVVTSSK